jgi:acyl-CoA reductase-like NAD-dependent aldehyde dehydrogenase
MIKYGLNNFGSSINTDSYFFYLHPDLQINNDSLSKEIRMLNRKKVSVDDAEIFAREHDIQHYLACWCLAEDIHVAKIAQSAKKVFSDLKETSIEQRVGALVEIGKGLEENLDRWKKINTFEFQNSFSFLAQHDFVREMYDPVNLRIKQSLVETKWVKDGRIHTLTRKPKGTVLVTYPPNAGYTMLNNTFSDLFLSGNPMILKAPKASALVSYELANFYNQTLKSLGLPESIAVVTGNSNRISDLLLNHENIEGMIFIGGQKGHSIRNKYSDLGKPINLEMNGSDIIIFSQDMSQEDFENSYREAVYDRFRGASGQFCRSPKRILIPKKYFGAAEEIAREIALSCKPGLISSDETDLIPCTDSNLDDQIERYKKDEKCIIIVPSKKVDFDGTENEKGIYRTAGVISIVNPDENTIFLEEEVFGPICQIGMYYSLDQAITIANSSNYNLRCSFNGFNKADKQKIKSEVESGGIFFDIKHLEAYGGFPVGGMELSCERDCGPRFFGDSFLDDKKSYFVEKQE